MSLQVSDILKGKVNHCKAGNQLLGNLLNQTQTSHQNLWEENPGPGVSFDQFSWDNPGAATWTEDFLSETIIKDKNFDLKGFVIS